MGGSQKKKKKKKKKSPPVLQMKRRNKEVKTSPVELGNCCQEWVGPPAVMRQHWAHVCINISELCILNNQAVEGLMKELTRVRPEKSHWPRESPSITGAEE